MKYSISYFFNEFTGNLSTREPMTRKELLKFFASCDYYIKQYPEDSITIIFGHFIVKEFYSETFDRYIVRVMYGYDFHTIADYYNSLKKVGKSILYFLKHQTEDDDYNTMLINSFSNLSTELPF